MKVKCTFLKDGQYVEGFLISVITAELVPGKWRGTVTEGVVAYRPANSPKTTPFEVLEVPLSTIRLDPSF